MQILTHWLLELFTENTFFEYYCGDFQLGMGRIRSNLPKKAFGTWWHAFLFTSTTFYDLFVRACIEMQILRLLIFNLESIYYFASCTCSGGPGFTPSLPVRHLETQGELPYETWRQGMLNRKFEFNSHGKFIWTLPELHYIPKRYHLGSITSCCSAEDPVVLVDPTRVIKRSAAWKQKLNENVSFNIIISSSAP